MTEQELNAIYYLDIQIRRIKRRIAELPADTIGGGGDISGVRSSMPGDPTGRLAQKKIQLLEQLNETLEKKIDAEIKIRAFIDRVEDEEIKTILELRCIYQENWEDIGIELHADRTTVSRKFRAYIKQFKKCPQIP